MDTACVLCDAGTQVLHIIYMHVSPQRLALILSLNIEYLPSGENVQSLVPSLHAVSIVHPRGVP